MAEFDNIRSFTEGWGIFSIEPPVRNDESFQLQGLANDEAGPTPFYEDDDGAVAFVIGQAAAGSDYHLSALRFLAQHSPRELENYPEIAVVLAVAEGQAT